MWAAARQFARMFLQALSPSALASSATSRAGPRTRRNPDHDVGELTMCGIIGYIGPKEVVPVLIDGLRRLEYRGYDSAGVAVVHDGVVELRRSAGKLSNLETVIRNSPLVGEYGVGHTRGATHRRPTPEDAP